MEPEAVRDFYRQYSEEITAKRYNSPFAVRRHAHLSRVACLLTHLPPRSSVLEVGSGDGFFAVLAALQGLHVTGVDLSAGNVDRAREAASKNGVQGSCTFLQADAEALPFEDSSFDVVVASHVLEHLPDFDKGVGEVYRVCRKTAVIALPTPLNASAVVVLGGGNFWQMSRRSLLAFPVGAVRVLAALVSGEVGVDENAYAGRQDLPHIWFFPGRMRRRLLDAGFDRVDYEADALSLPYFESLVGFSAYLERWRHARVLRSFGYGTHYICTKS